MIKAVVLAIALIINQPVEHGIIMTPTGKILTHRVGNKDSIAFEDSKSMANNIFIHNHPTGQSFSIDDVENAINTNTKTIIVVGRNCLGQKYGYEMDRGNKWPSLNKFEKVYGYYDRKTFLDEQKFTGAKDTDCYLNSFHDHIVWFRVCNKLGIRYRRWRL